MTAILAVVGARRMPGADLVADVLRQAGGRARSAVPATFREAGGVFGSAQHVRATNAAQPAHDAGLAFDDRFVVVADATLYYLAELRRKLALPPAPRAETPAELLLAAFRVFGERCVDHLEGDFAFAVWDRHVRRLFCARDFTGRRPLHVAEYRGGLVVASTIASVAELPGFDAEIDLGVVGADAAGLFFALDDETCVCGIRLLGAGCTATWSAREPLRVVRVWQPTPSNEAPPLDFDTGARHLRALLEGAVLERIDGGDDPTTVWMSGGRDSTAVFGAGMQALRASADRRALLPISRSHPPGDSGREDEAVAAIAHFWNVVPSWVDVRAVPMFAADGASHPWSTEPFEQPFAQLTHRLAQAAGEAGSSVALDGHGGDFLFQVSSAYLADLVARGRVPRAWRDWRAMDRGHAGVRGFLRAGVQPLLPPWALRIAGAARGQPIRGGMERVAPPWISSRFLAAHQIDERLRARGPGAQPGATVVEREVAFYLTHSFFARVNAMMAGYALQYGVELRSPLLDQRVVSFALGRPREERNSAGDQKRLLRAAMRGLLPESVLAPRVGKTGTLTNYFAFHMTHDGLAALRHMLPAPALAERGIVDPGVLSTEVERFAAQGFAYRHTEALFCTLQAERWLGRCDTAFAPSRADPVTARSA